VTVRAKKTGNLLTNDVQGGSGTSTFFLNSRTNAIRLPPRIIFANRIWTINKSVPRTSKIHAGAGIDSGMGIPGTIETMTNLLEICRCIL
jgi:hypothetical protein